MLLQLRRGSERQHDKTVLQERKWIMEPTVETAANEIIEATQAIIDYTPQLDEIERLISMNADASVRNSGFLLFFVVVILCYFAYKFFRIFF